MKRDLYGNGARPRASSRCSRSRRYPAARPWASRRRTSIPHATFAAYRTHDGLAIARAEGGAAGTVDAAGWSGLAPAYRVEVGGQVIGELRVPSTAQLEIRAPGAGTVQGEIVPLGRRRLAIRPTTGDALRTRSFRTVETTSGLSLITRNAQTNLDLRGTYRSDLRDAGDHVVGWLQVRVWEPSGRRVYEAVFPPGFPVADATAAALSLDSELDWIRRYVLDTLRGQAGSIARKRSGKTAAARQASPLPADRGILDGRLSRTLRIQPDRSVAGSRPSNRAPPAAGREE